MIKIKNTCRGCNWMQLKNDKGSGSDRLKYYCGLKDKWLESINLLENKKKKCEGFKPL